jgi:hypothetical protein
MTEIIKQIDHHEGIRGILNNIDSMAGCNHGTVLVLMMPAIVILQEIPQAYVAQASFYVTYLLYVSSIVLDPK